MSSLKKLEFDVEMEAPAHLFYDVVANKPHSISSMVPDTIQKSTPESGKDGTVMNFDYNLDGKQKTAKDIVEKKDEKNLSIIWKIIEGDLLKEYKNFKIGMQAIPRGTGGLVHWTFEYEKNAGSPDPHSLMEFTVQSMKSVDAYLMNAQLNSA